MTPVQLIYTRERQKQLAELPANDAQAKLIGMWLHGKADVTISRYRYYSTVFLAHLAGVGKTLVSCTAEDLWEFAQMLGESGKAQSTQKTYLAAIKSLLSFSHKIGYTRFNVGAAMKLKKTADALHERLLTETDVALMIRLTERASYRYKADKSRDVLMLKLLYTAGLRVSELVGLTWGDVTARGERGQITVRGKGDKTRSILLPKHLWDELMTFKGDASGDTPIFRSRKGGGALHRQNIDPIIKAAAQRAGLTDKVSAHWLRHAHATHALERNANIGLVQRTMGHDNVSTTSRYLHARPDDSSALYVAAV
jgi:integrase/recombinase XerD